MAGRNFSLCQFYKLTTDTTRAVVVSVELVSAAIMDAMDEELSMRTAHGARPIAILPWLYIGNKEHAKNAALLRQLGVKHVVNCSPSRERDPKFGISNYFERSTTSAALTYLRVPIYDNRGETVRSGTTET
jgi:hypothetical protein